MTAPERAGQGPARRHPHTARGSTGMIRVTIAYPRVAAAGFDHDYYFNRHLPLLIRRIGTAAARMTVERGVNAAPWPDALHEVVCTFVCESREAFEAAFFPHIEELQDDMDRCGGGAPLILISDIVVDWPLADNDSTASAPLRVRAAVRARRHAAGTATNG